MFDREPNIDIVFRNGLKDFEVLPPADVWEQMPPVPVRQHRYHVFVGIAAGLAVVFSLSVIASYMARNIEMAETRTQLAALIDNSDSPIEPALLKSTVINPISPLKILASLPTEHFVRKDETLMTGYNTPAMPVIADRENGSLPETVMKTTTLISAGDAFIVFPGDLYVAPEPERHLAVIAKKTVAGDRFMVGASMSPTIAASSSGNTDRLNELLKGEKGLPSYSTGLSFAYKISSRLSIQSGIGYSSIGQMITDIDVYAGLSDYYSAKGGALFNVETASGTIYSGNPDIYITDAMNRTSTSIPSGAEDPSKYRFDHLSDNLHQVFRYLEVPLTLRYKVIDRNIDLNVSGGMAYGFLVDNSVYTIYDGSLVPVGHTEGANLHSFSSQLGLGMEYNLSKQISFNIEPLVRYYLTPVSNSSGTYARPLSFGIFSGFFFRF